jgi:8-amino-7-oxononanoate synthase
MAEPRRPSQASCCGGIFASVILDDSLRLELDDLTNRDRLRETRSYSRRDHVHLRDAAGRELLSFCSNDYLGLSSAPQVAARTDRSPIATGAGGSRLVTGGGPEHDALEQQLAALVGAPTALLFPTGYQTNIGVLTALANAQDLIVSDVANHASLIDGCRLSRARIVVYRHVDAASAEQALSTPGSFRRRFIVTESIFSMDGDRAPLAELADSARLSRAALIVDEAHALGVVGPEGRGLAAACAVQPDVVVGTLGKTFASLGGFAAGSETLRAILVNRARTFIFTTAPPPGIMAASSAHLAFSLTSAGSKRRTHVASLSGYLRDRLTQIRISTTGQDHIIPLVVGSDRDALAISNSLLERGFLVPAIRPPTVPEGTARLRLTLSATHTVEDIDRLVDALSVSWRSPSTPSEGV